MTGQAVGINVVFIDELYAVEPTGSVTFGREADIVVDETNPYMHRLVGSFLHHNGVWWLRNEGRRTELTLRTDAGARSVLPTGQSAALTSSGTVEFESGAGTYDLTYAVQGALELPPLPTSADGNDPSMTREFGVISLNDEQRLLLTALCEPRLRDPNAGPDAIPARAQVAHKLGWSVKKFDRKLDYICARLADDGVRGLRGGKGVEANARRSNLVDHALISRIITADDLSLLDQS